MKNKIEMVIQSLYNSLVESVHLEFEKEIIVVDDFSTGGTRDRFCFVILK